MFDLSFTLDVGDVLNFEDFAPDWFETRALVRVGEAIAEDARLRLEDDDEAPDGTQWDDWSEEYAASRTASDKLLYDEGRLSDSLDVRMRGGVMRLESNVPYARAQMYGNPDTNLPTRPYAGISRDLEASLSEILDTDLERSWGRART